MEPEASPDRPDAVVFDFGGVLVDWDPRYLYEKIIADPAEREWFLAEVCNGAWIVQQDHGRTWQQANTELIVRYPDRRHEIEAFRARWSEMLRGPIAGTVAILERLHERGHRLLALSNWAADTFEMSRWRLPFLDLFDGLVISGQVGLSKPDPLIFHHMAHTHGVALENCVFVDDAARNVEAARALGIDAIHFETPAQLERELLSRGLLTAA